MGTMQQFQQLFDYLPDAEFFAKDVEGRFVAAGAATLRRMGLEREEELIGKDDSAIHPPNVARAIRADDLRVMRTRTPLVNRAEALFVEMKAKTWFLTTKLPIIDPCGEVIGVMGFITPDRGIAGGGEEEQQLRRVVEHIHEHFRGPLSVADLAKIAHLSERQLNRRFQKVFRTSAQDFIVRMRIQAASDALVETDKQVSQIAAEHGFYDQSAFTRQFRQHVGETPLVFRRRRRAVQSRPCRT